MPATVLVDDAPLAQVGVDLLKVFNVTNVATALGTLISGGIPKLTRPGRIGSEYPVGVLLWSTHATAIVLMSPDGRVTPVIATLLGVRLPISPAIMTAPVPEGLTLNNILLVSDTNPTICGALFYF